MQVARDPLALLDRALDLAALGDDEIGGRALTLADDGAQKQGRECGDRDIQLGTERGLRDRVLHERPDMVGRVPDGHARRAGDGDRRARLAEPYRGPDQRREHEERERPAAGELELAEPDDGGDHRRDLERACGAPGGRVRPGEDQRKDDQRARGVPEPERAPHVGELMAVNDAVREQ